MADRVTVLAAEIVTSYVSTNAVSIIDIPDLIAGVYSALSGASAPNAVSPAKATPAEIRKSVRPDHLVSFIDGKSYKILKRHLTKHGLDFAAYRARFGLPDDYPSTAASHSKRQAAVARAVGLRRGRDGESRNGEPNIVAARPTAPSQNPDERGPDQTVFEPPLPVMVQSDAVGGSIGQIRADPLLGAHDCAGDSGLERPAQSCEKASAVSP